VDVDELCARAEIHHVLMSYFRHVDRLNLGLVRDLFFDDAYLNYRSYQGSIGGFVDEYLVDLPLRYARTVHFAGNVIIDLEGDAARTETYCIGHHTWNPEFRSDASFMVVWLRYLDRFERRHGEWKIARRDVVYDWVRTAHAGEWGEIAAEYSGRRWPNDLVYQR
jgi:hypothetical protein